MIEQPALVRVLESAAHLQEIVPDAVLVGESTGARGGVVSVSFRNVDVDPTAAVETGPTRRSSRSSSEARSPTGSC
ncbi:hypothetical protein LP422_01745 [Janibacter limosus]|uniref:Uncharacterized protein n=1 Tax=Janibacter limosus TaxID=53458 RepID=A0AC61U5F4_9MICO|nr:hypothetical protein [Janibacter limosus]UUZ45081.1 hypothetical protein LP422_01745 [Janibacter limosus]